MSANEADGTSPSQQAFDAWCKLARRWKIPILGEDGRVRSTEELAKLIPAALRKMTRDIREAEGERRAMLVELLSFDPDDIASSLEEATVKYQPGSRYFEGLVGDCAIRECRGCGALLAGGPVHCRACARG